MPDTRQYTPPAAATPTTSPKGAAPVKYRVLHGMYAELIGNTVVVFGPGAEFTPNAQTYCGRGSNTTKFLVIG
jgi:hypothetical protein